MHYNCLIVDDETDLAKMTCEYFMMFDVNCTYVDNSSSCIEFLQKNDVDLILLDINLTNESGFNLCKSIREFSNIPILFISARQSDDDILIALNIGGDDYIKKPYTLSVLLAKVKVMLKRMALSNEFYSGNGTGLNVPTEGEVIEESIVKSNTTKENIEDMIEKDRIYLDRATFGVFVDGKKVILKSKEFSLLECLYKHKNSIVTKEELFDSVWGDSFYSDSTLNVHIRRIREKIEKNPSEPEFIKTVWGTGYILEINV